ncbi:non-structural maintenance of chromosomes element 4 homolog A isoform X2 [Hydra vulgaris]|uniref:Non-structural maintenance of chromosomes element 4 n=1 Tax=Hydra vulgaris TaxID=6087 RepID=A0ABM4BCF3_HYDVU
MASNKENMCSKLDSKQKYDDPKVRRQIRAEYRSLAFELNENAEESSNTDSANLQEYIEKVEGLFTKVRHPREAVHDSSLLVTLTKKGRQQAQQLKTDLVSFDNHTFIEKIISFVSGRNISDILGEDNDICDLSNTAWKQLGNECRPLFKKTPHFDFLLGPLVLKVIAKERIQRTANREKLPQGDALKLKIIDSVDEKEEATTKEVERVYKILKKSTNNGMQAVCLFQFIINPTSFGQSVENLFHLSFLIKDGRATIELDEQKCPTINLHKEYNETEYADIVYKKQVIMTLTMADWKEIIEVYKINEPTIPTREWFITT